MIFERVLYGDNTLFYHDLAKQLKTELRTEVQDTTLSIIAMGVQPRAYKSYQQISLNLPISLTDLRQKITDIESNGFLVGQIFCDTKNRLLCNIPMQQTIALTEKEVDILAYLYSHQAASAETLLKAIWNYNEHINTKTLETHLARLKQKFPYLQYVNGAYKINPNIDVNKSSES